MCGITGIASISGTQRIDFDHLKQMNSKIVHRGPDDEGYLLFNLQNSSAKAFDGEDSCCSSERSVEQYKGDYHAQLGFGFRRLPTLELSYSGHQPMFDKKLGLAVIFNGEIYNHVELREELVAKGYEFFSHSDTEVIIKAYHAWGDDCVLHLNGMWAFAIWDVGAKRLFMSRDRFGIKPFYYLIDGDMLYWGSEIKQLLELPYLQELNTAAIWRATKINSFLAYSDETYWKDVRSLEPGKIMILQGGKLSQKTYYQLDEESFEKSEISFEEAKEKYLELFLDSLRMQLRSDVQIGASLSGGLDSGAIVSFAGEFVDYPFRTFSTYYEESARLDERKYIRMIAENSGAKTCYISPNADNAAQWLSEAIWLNDLPVNAGFVSQYALMKKAKEVGMKVLLSGLGPDEFMGGYHHAGYRYFADLLRGGKIGDFAGEIKHFAGSSPKEVVSNMGKILLSASMKESTLYKLESQFYHFEPFNKDFVNTAHKEAGAPIMDKLADLGASKLNSFMLNMVDCGMLKTQLHYEDRMSMGHSVESRMPFLDHRLVDFVFTLPANYKNRPPYRKALHREALGHSMPAEVVNRKDKGIFGSPLTNHWLRKQLKNFVEDIIYSTRFRHRGIWNLPVIHRKWQGYLSGNNGDAEMLFNVLSLEMWFRIFEVNR